MELPPPLVLTESDADKFLESVGVELYEDEISINGTIYEGTYGESILEANGIFLYEDGIVLEGKQKDEYLARKAKEKQDAEKAEDDRYMRRHKPNSNYNIVGNRFSKHPEKKAIYKNAYEDEGNDPDGKNYEKTIGADSRRHNAGWNRSVKAIYDGQIKAFHGKDEHNVADTYNRHIRRHPKQYAKKYNESTIFSDIEII